MSSGVRMLGPEVTSIIDGDNSLRVNPDGSIDVNITDTGVPSVNVYNAITSVPSASLTTVLTYTALVNLSLKQIQVSGTNIAEYSIRVNGTTVDLQRTYFGGDLNCFFNFGSGINVSAADVVTVKVIHSRPTLGDFNARMQLLER